jgi:hypothetical protein
MKKFRSKFSQKSGFSLCFSANISPSSFSICRPFCHSSAAPSWPRATQPSPPTQLLADDKNHHHPNLFFFSSALLQWFFLPLTRP